MAVQQKCQAPSIGHTLACKWFQTRHGRNTLYISHLCRTRGTNRPDVANASKGQLGPNDTQTYITKEISNKKMFLPCMFLSRRQQGNSLPVPTQADRNSHTNGQEQPTLG